MWHSSSYELGDATHGTSYSPGGRSMHCSSYALGALAATEEHVVGASCGIGGRRCYGRTAGWPYAPHRYP
jgi:hypothetical protein